MMVKLYKSLMRGSLGEQIAWPEEWEKANQAKADLFKVIDTMPSVLGILRNMLESELKRLGKTVEVDKVYINTDPALPADERRPSGTLLDVTVYCLNNNVSPAYILGGDGVFFLPDTFSEQFKVNVLNTLIVEDLIAAVAGGLEKTLRTEIAKFWAAPAKPMRADNAPLSNKQAFIEAYAVVSSAELSLSAMANNFDAGLAERFAHLLAADSGRAAFEVKLQPVPNYLLSLQPCFVLDNSERADVEMPLVNESTSYLMHTPENGFEFFEKNTDLHSKLQQRMSLRSEQIRYLKATQSPHAFCVETHLKGQLESVSSLVDGRDQLDNSLISALQENQGLHVLRYGINTRFYLLWAALKRTDWPLWLHAAGSDLQQRYNELEESKEQYQAAYSSVFDACFAFRDYVVRTFAAWADRVLGEQLDPEAISVHSSYSLQIAGRTIEQEDTRTLTEFIVFGLHDSGYKATLTVTGAPDGSRLTAAALEQWLENRNLRLEFTGSLASSPSADYQEAYRNYLISQLKFAAFVARHSGKLDSTDANIIARATASDPAVTIQGLRIRLQVPALKDVLIISARGYVPSLMLVKTPDGEFELQKFSDIYAANRWLESALSANREYAALLIHPEYLHEAGQLLGLDRTELNYRYTLDSQPVDLGLNAKAPLADYANIAYRAEVALHKAIAPVGYRVLGFEGRKRYSRLTTELRALSTVDARDNGFPTFEQFTYDSVKAQIEEILRTRGSNVSVNPDQIIVQTEEFRKSVTDILLEGLAFEAVHPAYETKFSPKYYLVNGHPVVEKLDIRDLSSLSKTFRPGDRYTAMLKEQFQKRAHPDYAFKRAVHARKIRCEMYCNAFADFTNGRLSTESFSAIQRVIDNLKESGGYQAVRDTVSEGDAGLYKFNIGTLGLTAAGDKTVGGVYVFRLKLSSGFVDLLYTPDAPDQVSFRPIAEFIPSILFRLGPFRNYYSERILLVDQKVINDYFDRLVATVDSRPVIRTQQRSLLPDLFTFHDERVRRVLSDIDERTISLNEIIAGLVYDNLLKAANIVSLLVPPVGTVVVAVQMMKSIYDASQSHRRGDYSAALGHVKDALFGLLTLGKAAAAGAPAKEITRAQRSFLDLFGDARTVAELVTYYTGHQDPQDELLGFFKSLMEDAGSALSKTTVR
jgi:hypothetical protein